MDRSTAVSTVLAILLALVAVAMGLMHPSLWWLTIALSVVAVLVSPSPP
jgi:hypothetical protein